MLTAYQLIEGFGALCIACALCTYVLYWTTKY